MTLQVKIFDNPYSYKKWVEDYSFPHWIELIDVTRWDRVNGATNSLLVTYKEKYG